MRLKKMICTTLAICVLGGVLSACSSPNIPKLDNVVVPETNQFADIGGFSSQGEVSLLPVEIGATGFSSDTGYYHVDTNKNGSAVLQFVDYASAKDVVVCNRPECKHKDESCTAYIPFGSSGVNPIPVGDKLILLYAGNPFNFDMVGNVGAARIEVMEQNGANRTIPYVFDGTTSISTGLGIDKRSFAKDEQNLYFIAEQILKSSNGVEVKPFLCAYNISSQQVFMLKELDSNPRIIGAFADNIVLEYAAGIEIVGTDASSIQAEIEVFSLSTLQGSQVATHPYIEHVRCEGNMCYRITQTGDLAAIDLSTGEEKVIAAGIVSPETEFLIEGLQDGKLFLTFTTMRTEANEKGEEIIFVDKVLHGVDLQSGTIAELSVPYYEGGSGRVPKKILASAGQDYLCLDSTEDIAITSLNNEGKATTVPSYKTLYALQNKEDYLNGGQQMRAVTEIS